MWNEFLKTVGVPLRRVTSVYAQAFLRRAVVPLSRIVSIWKGFVRIQEFSLNPLIWSYKKFENADEIYTSPGYAAVLATATSLATLPFILFARLYSGIARFLVYFVNDIKWVQSLKDFIDFLGNPLDYRLSQGYHEPGYFHELPDPSSPVEQTLLEVPRFGRWMSSLKPDKPIQILADRIVLKENGSKDVLPAVKTAVSALSGLNKDYKAYQQSVQKEMQRSKTKKPLRKRS
jgi:hypothetical protein